MAANFAYLRRTALYFIKKNKHDMGKAKVTSYKQARLGAMINPDYKDFFQGKPAAVHAHP